MGRGRAVRPGKSDSGHADTISITRRVRQASRNAMKSRIQCVVNPGSSASGGRAAASRGGRRFRVTLCRGARRVGRMLSGAQRRNGELCRPNHSLSSARRSRQTPDRSPRSSRTTSRPAWQRSRRSRRQRRTGGSGSASWPRGTCPSWWPRSQRPGAGWPGLEWARAGWPGATGLSAALPTLVRGGLRPPTGTRSRTPCTSPPAAPAAGSAAPCSVRCWPGARRPARGRSLRSSPIPAATPRPRCTAGSALPRRACCPASAASTAAGSTPC